MKKKRGVRLKSAIQNTKEKIYKFQSSKENIQGTNHPLIRVETKKKSESRMKAAIQNTKKRDTIFNYQKKTFKVHTIH